MEYFACLPEQLSHGLLPQNIVIQGDAKLSIFPLKNAAASSAVNYLACQQHRVHQHVYYIMFLRTATVLLE